MKMQTIGLSIAAALLLAACGGGGETSPTPADPKPNDNNTVSGVNKNIGKATNVANGTYRGEMAVVSTGRGINANSPIRNIASDSLATLNVNGKQVELQFANLHVGSIMTLTNSTIFGRSYRNFIVSGSNYTSSRFGYVNTGAGDNESYIFSMGAYTTDMPVSGSARYHGSAAIVHEGVGEAADTSFTADFAGKTLVGTIKPGERSQLNFNPVQINANINGNAFSTAEGAPIASAGHFYGSNARELGGIFHDSTQNISGSYGAIKQ